MYRYYVAKLRLYKCLSLIVSLSLFLFLFLFLSFSLSLSLLQDDDVCDRLQKAMRGEIAGGSYGPLSAYTQRNKISTSPVPVHRGQGGAVQRSKVKGQPLLTQRSKLLRQ